MPHTTPPPPDDEPGSSRMTLAVYVVRADGTREVRRPRTLVAPVQDVAWSLTMREPECTCPRHRAADHVHARKAGRA